MDDSNPSSETVVSPSDTVGALLDELTLEEKCSLVHGDPTPGRNPAGYLAGVPRLGVPELRFTDGPLGVRTDDPVTAFPSPLALAASFDPSLAREMGAAIAREAKAHDQHVLLAPGLNLVRVPHCGRNFEYYSEDPIVTGRFAAAAVEGIQWERVVATPKHYVANNQETRRAHVDVVVDECVLRELYLPGFRDAVEAGAGAIMTSYSKVNGTYASEHRRLLRDVLKGEWGFDGFVVSDWYGTASGPAAANGGLDLEMPGEACEDYYEAAGVERDEAIEGAAADLFGGLPDPGMGGFFAETLLDAVRSGAVSESRVDDMVARILGQVERFGRLDGTLDAGAVDTPEHRELAERIATRGTVLLEAGGVLPLAADADVALVGPNVHEALLGGGGSSQTRAAAPTSPVVGIADRAGGDVEVARGHPPLASTSLFDVLNGVVEEDGGPAHSDGDVGDAIEAAADADAAVVFVRDVATEAADRDALALPGDQDELVEAVAEANDRTVVVVNASGPVELPWREDVASILLQWYPGQAHGEAIASVLYGDADPGGRLPVTFAPEDSYPTARERRFPGVDDEVVYEEGLLVGYRFFDATGTEPTYPFGHGHSYATFDYGDLDVVDDRTVSVTVGNEGDRDGFEVVQAYVAAPEAPDDFARPPRELAGFEAVEVPGSETRTVDLSLDDRAFGRYDADEGWTVDGGTYVVSVGRSSRDLRSQVRIER